MYYNDVGAYKVTSHFRVDGHLSKVIRLVKVSSLLAQLACRTATRLVINFEQQTLTGAKLYDDC